MGFLPSFGRSSPVSESKSISNPFRLPFGSADYPAHDFTSIVDNAFGKNELVYACVMEKATSTPEAPLRVFRSDGHGDPDESHPLRLLLKNPNPRMTEFELWEMTIIHLDLAGNAFWHMVRDRSGRVVELWPLRPDCVRILPKGHYGYQPEHEVIPLGTDVLHFKYPNPVDPHLGQAPLRPAIRAVALDNEATDFVKALLQNHAVPGVVIETQEAVDQAVADMLKQRWKAAYGGRNRGEPAILQAGMAVKPLGLNLRDLEFPDLRTISETRICSALGVPPILVGAKAGLERSTFANYAEARKSFWEDTIMPLQRRLAEVVVKKLLPEFQGQRPRAVEVRFDNSNVVALKEVERDKWERATMALRAGGISVNTFLRQIGEPEVGDAGQFFLRPAGVLPVPIDDPTAGLTLLEQQQQQQPEPDPNEEDEDDDG